MSEGGVAIGVPLTGDAEHVAGKVAFQYRD